MATHNNNNSNTDATITEERRHPTEPENLGCPRCDSTNTKFCYYNNYNLSQPRYFCKSCRRYWTRGGTLRNIPVGGGTRKNSKRSRSSSSLPVGPTVTPPPPTPLMFEIQKVVKTTDEAVSKWQDDLELNMNQGSFTSLLTTNNNANANTNTNINTNASGYGFGLEYGIGQASYDDLGFGIGASMSVGDETHGQQIMGEVQNGGSNTWQFGGGEGMDGAGCFGWPDLAI